jgi:hypothetical protein
MRPLANLPRFNKAMTPGLSTDPSGIVAKSLFFHLPFANSRLDLLGKLLFISVNMVIINGNGE